MHFVHCLVKYSDLYESNGLCIRDYSRFSLSVCVRVSMARRETIWWASLS